MLSSFKKFFDSKIANTEEEISSSVKKADLACAALLIEVINSDHELDEREYEEKVGLIENMWRIAFSDEQLDKYEEHLIRKISDLIYVSHSDFIKTKLNVRK